jgi:DNA-binding transcriptional MerR regulator
MFFKSREVAKRLGITYRVLFEMLRRGRLDPPAKDSSGDYVWTEADVERAQAALASRRRPVTCPWRRREEPAGA